MDENNAINLDELQDVSGGATTHPSVTYKCFSYVIKSGDTLSELALKYHTTVPVLCEINNIKNPNMIYAGNKIFIPYFN